MIRKLEERARAAFAPAGAAGAIPLWTIAKNQPSETRKTGSGLSDAPATARNWAETSGFNGEADSALLAPGDDGAIGAAFYGLGATRSSVRFGAAPRHLSVGGFAGRVYEWRNPDEDAVAAALAWALGGYRFEQYRMNCDQGSKLALPEVAMTADAFDRIIALATGVYLARDLVNTPAGDLGPAGLEHAARELAEAHGAEISVIEGDALLRHDYPMVHAVGRGGPEAPRLIDLRWGDPSAAKATLVGKGVTFDTGGLDVKPRNAMRNMKKDMGGAAAAMALAHMVMALRAPVRLRLLIPAVENSIDAMSFRPGDILTARNGKTVEIGDTDAEGRLMLADALAEADSEKPDLLFDFATLTGAARVALGPEVVPFYTNDDSLAARLYDAGARVADPLWRMPLWDGYERDLSSSVADMSNISSSGLAGSVTAALFLRRFVRETRGWAHFDIFAWNPSARPGRPEGGECQAARAAFEVIEAMARDRRSLT